MKKYNLIIAILLICQGIYIQPSIAQEYTPDSGISAIPVRLEQRGEFLHIDIDFAVNNLRVKSAQGLNLIPQLVSADQTYTLPMVSFKGRSEYYAYERTLAIMSKAERAAYQAPYTVEKAYKLENDTIHYRHVIPYEPWMADARLDIQRDDCGCGKAELMDVENLVEKVTTETPLLPYTITPHLAYVQPVAEEIKQREIQAEAFLDFVVNKTDIRPDYMNNPRELGKIHAMIDDLKNDASIKVNRLDIIGYASPEGSLANNKRLSEGRALALRDYLSSHYEFPRNQYHIVFGGENWDGLVRALNNINMEYKEEVLAIIAHNSIEAGRESKLMRLEGGGPYRYMLKNIFPSLRVAICKVSYSVKNFNVDEAQEMISKRPQNLSLNEMFLVANTYPQGSQAFIDVFETAVRMFPEDEIANLNAAASAIQRNDLVSAERYLNKITSAKHMPQYSNIAGILAMMKGAYDEAGEYLQTAANSGLEEAKANLNELARKRLNEEEMKKRKQNN